MRFLKQLVPQSLRNYYHLLSSLCAAVRYSFPAKKLKIIGVTGTDGKTTTANLIYHLLKEAHYKVSLISTVNAVIGNKSYDTGFHVTTPDPDRLQKYLAEMVKSGSKYAVLEVTSHALDQNRISGLKFLAAVVTNVTPEHLDYHKSYFVYLQTKAKLFKNVAFSILNRDDSSFPVFHDLAEGEIITYSLKEKANFQAKNIDYSPKETRFTLVHGGKELNLTTNLIGDFNLYNVLAAISLVKAVNISDEVMISGLKNFEGVPGRMEKIKTKSGLDVFIDFAHTPNSLEKVLKLVKNITRGKIIVCFGAAAERDITKRPFMGRIAAKLAHYVILTNEDPRWEDPNKILTDIAKGVVKGGGVLNKTFWMIEDRSKAIKFSVEKAKPGDTVLILGKGHEKSISVKGREYPWSDKEAVLKVLEL